MMLKYNATVIVRVLDIFWAKLPIFWWLLN